MKLADNIEDLKGIGPKRAIALRHLGIGRIYDLLTYFPRSYEDQSCITAIADLQAGEKATVSGVIRALQEKRAGRRGMVILTALIDDGTGSMQLTWFNQKFLKTKLKTGKRVFATGKIAYAYGGQGQFAMSQMSSYEILDMAEDAEEKCGILPVYSVTEKITQKFLRGMTRTVLDLLGISDNEMREVQCSGTPELMLEEVLNSAVRRKYGLVSAWEALQWVHYPRTAEDVQQARRRLAFEELYLIQTGLLYLKKRTQEKQKGIQHVASGELVTKLRANLPFSLTEDQANAWRDICEDMERQVPMRRLVQGDVGSGKTVIAMLALVKTVENGHQGALMAPTEILARQHYESFRAMLKPFNIRVELLSGKLNKRQRTDIYERLAAQEIDIVIGTHALIQDEVQFASLGLVVTDEQHRFGINQRALLEKKGDSIPDVLVMTATPIPRTLTLTVYGDLDVSLIKQLPPGRKPIRTFVRGEERRELIYQFVLEEIKKGRQAYVVCPLIEMNEESNIASAEEVYEELRHGIFRGIACGLVHGKLKQTEKEAVMQSFYAGEIKLLVATTVIEVGVNVPNASIMVIENAQQFGLAQLHQLRGRIGRGEYASYCILVSQGRTDTARQRMHIMETTSDGFALAEEDLRLRGPGQFFGTLQHGLPDLKVADVSSDIELLLQAREAALETVHSHADMSPVLARLALQYQEQFFNIMEN